MIVTKENLAETIERFSKGGQYAVDTETTGLYPYRGDRLFSIILCDYVGACYFNFQDYGDGSPVLEDPGCLRDIFANPDSYWFAHNAKFDLAMLRFAGLDVKGTVHCTQAIGKVIRNNKFSYSLDNLAKERGFAKSDAVEAYIKTHKLWTWREVPGKKQRKKDMHYDKVPFDIISSYGLTDGVITRGLGLAQLVDIEQVSGTTSKTLGTIKDVYLNELSVTKAVFDMEWEGVQIDADYVAEALRYEQAIQDEAEARFEKLTGCPFKDSPKALAETFTKLGVPFVRNEPTELMIKKAHAKGEAAVGNPCFNSDALATVEHEAASLVLMQRGALKKAGTYYRSFQYLSDDNDTIHCNIKQDGPDTGRMSCAEPNLQNVPKRGEDKSNYPVRKSFVPPPEFCYAMFDYDQMEFRLMVEYAKEFQLIDKIKSGLDVHTATAEQMKVNRTHAKTLNFMLIYGGGNQKLADALGISFDDAYGLREAYFKAMPGVKKLISSIIHTTKERGFIVNWLGRRCYFDDPNFAYKAPNYLIQGGCADVVKRALVSCSKRLTGMRSKLLLQIHDELVFKIHKDELGVIPDLKVCMEQAYPYKYLPLTVGVDHSWVSWHDKVEGLPTL